MAESVKNQPSFGEYLYEALHTLPNNLRPDSCCWYSCHFSFRPRRKLTRECPLPGSPVGRRSAAEETI